MKKLLIILTFVYSSICQSYAADYKEQYLTLSINPLCSAAGQVEIGFTNTSGEKLFVDPHFVDSTLFDAVNQSVHLTDVATDTRVIMSKRHEYSKLNYWSVLSSGQTVTHQIDFRDYANLDLKKSYRAGINAFIPIILEGGQEAVVRLNSSLLNKYSTFQPDCIP
jgi:hypothetical protein